MVEIVIGAVVLANIKKSIFAGILISVGCIINLTVGGPLGALLFSLGLMGVVVMELKLFTGIVGYTNEYLISTFLGNGIGCFIVGVIFHLSRIHDTLFYKARDLCFVKLADDGISIFALGIFCGMCMYIAVEMWKRTKNPLVVILPVMVFILAGFEHCIADMGYAMLALDPGMWCVILISACGNAVGAKFLNLVLTNNK